MNRNAELEAAIVAAPDDPAARMVYGDWLQAEGDPRGEWAAIRARLEADPGDHALRIAAIEFEGDHKKDLFGGGVKAIARAYVGWRGGFVDELRIEPHASITAPAMRALFAHPTVRFVRHVALGPLRGKLLEAAVAEMTSLPLLEELVIADAVMFNAHGELDAITQLPIAKLSLSGVWLRSPMPQLRELTILNGQSSLHIARWIEAGNCTQLEKLTVVEMTGEAASADLSNVIAKSGARATVTVISSAKLFEPSSVAEANPILELARTGGRAAIRHISMAGVALYNAAAHHLASKRPAHEAIPFADLAATLPTYLTGTWQLANAALAYERTGDLVTEELRAREALLYSPGEPNYFSFVIDALRRTGRILDAVALLPRAKKAMANPPKDSQVGGALACLIDCMMVLSQVGKHEEAIALAAQFPKLVDARVHAVLALAYLANGQLAKARVADRKSARGEDEHAIVHHAHAALLAHDGKRAAAKAAIAAAKSADYSDVHWIAADPVLGPLSR